MRIAFEAADRLGRNPHHLRQLRLGQLELLAAPPDLKANLWHCSARIVLVAAAGHRTMLPPKLASENQKRDKFSRRELRHPITDCMKRKPRPEQKTDRELLQLVGLIARELAAEHHREALRRRNHND
jgi:hypothetical protein